MRNKSYDIYISNTQFKSSALEDHTVPTIKLKFLHSVHYVKNKLLCPSTSP